MSTKIQHTSKPWILLICHTPSKSSSATSILLGLLLFLCCQATAQQYGDTLSFDLSKLQTALPIGEGTYFDTIPRDNFHAADLYLVNFAKKLPPSYSQRLGHRFLNQLILLKFNLKNNADSWQEFYFFPGLTCKSINLYKAASWPAQNGEIVQLPDSLGKTAGYIRYRLSPKENAVFLAKLDFVLSNQNVLQPQIISKEFLPFFRSSLAISRGNITMISYVTTGILLMMIIYSMNAFYQDTKKEFLFYSLYAGCLAGLVFFKAYLYGSTFQISTYFEGGFDFIFQMIGYIFYIAFIREFLNTRLNHPFLEKIFMATIWTLAGFLLLFCFFLLIPYNLTACSAINGSTKIGLLLASLTFIIYGIRKKEPLMNYLVAGQLFLTIFSLVSLLLSATSFRFFEPPNHVGNNPMLYYQIGLILDMVLFLFGLTYKNNRILIERVKERERLKLENERKDFEKQVAIMEARQQERNRISADMHDELGSGVTAIRLMSEIVKSKMKGDTLPEIDKISRSANDLLGKMNTIIWTMVSSNDTLESLVAYIRAYAVDFFENSTLQCQFDLPAQIPALAMSGEKRRNVFLSVKESLNNIIKHSQASVVTIRMKTDDEVFISISDNGIGINMDQLRRFGNGMKNMQKRIASVGGKCSIESHQGTRITFTMPFD